MRHPDFENLRKILKCQKPARPTLFEFLLNDDFYQRLAGDDVAEIDDNDPHRQQKIIIRAFCNAGYDYATLPGSDFKFAYAQHAQKSTFSLNELTMIVDEKSFRAYRWDEPDRYDYSVLDALRDFLPDGMKIIIRDNESVFAGVCRLMGYENLCAAIYENEDLVQAMFDAVGSRILLYNEICSQYESVGAVIVNDDMGFKTQTMLSPDHLRKYCFPWHKKIVDAIHRAGKPAILHSCGNLREVYEDVIVDLHYDGKHSFEDAICPVEAVYDQYAGRIAILGGIDLDFLTRQTPGEIRKRSAAMLERSLDKGGYALGSGNSIPSYIPYDNYRAMISAIDFAQ
jgi:uroporphyrinogen decarboxylase